MLNQKTIDIIKSTVPVLQEHGEALSKHFYKRLFLHNPEVMPFFNHSNQQKSIQQRALAKAITAYAANIDNLEVLGSAVELIAHKHASLQVKPEHYPIVGENLLESIKEVLGDAATDDIIEAWAEAYEFLADILQGREQQIYDASANKPGGWEGFRHFKVERKEPESSVITSFYLKPGDGGEVPTHLAGQYITLRMPTPDGSTTMRNYSLSDKPGQNHFRISVKLESAADADAPNGYVSNKLHNEIKVGDVLEVGPPCGEFCFNADDKRTRPLVLLAAGVGITPILSILLMALDAKMPHQPIVFIHACIDEETQAFKDTVDQLAAEHPTLTAHYCYKNPVGDAVTGKGNASKGYVTGKLIDSLVPSRDADYYFCGPKGFMSTVYHALLGWDIPEAQIHFEFFAPKQELENPALIKTA